MDEPLRSPSIIGLPDPMWCHSIRRSSCYVRMAATRQLGAAIRDDAITRRSAYLVEFACTRSPESKLVFDVARHSRLRSSITHAVRKGHRVVSKDEVQAPALAFAGSSLAHGQPLLAIEPVKSSWAGPTDFRHLIILGGPYYTWLLASR
jgi:hypothetical protein